MFAWYWQVFLLLLAFPSNAPAGGSWSDRFYLNGPDGEVSALLVHDGALYAGGQFASIGSMPARRIARFDGSEWSALGSGINGNVRALAEYDGDLIAAGSFQWAGDVPAVNVARWDGASWHPLGDGLPSEALSLIVFNGDLIAGTTGHGVMSWDGTAWSRMGGGFQAHVGCLAVYQGELFAGSLGWIPAGDDYRYVFVWRWNGSSWAPLSTCAAFFWTDFGPEIISLQVVNDKLYAVGTMVLDDDGHGGLSFWDGTGWNNVPHGWTTGGYYEHAWPGVILPYDGKLLLGGSFWGTTGGTSHSMALYDGSGWSPLPGGGLQIFDLYGDSGPRVHAMAEYQGDVYVAGGFAGAGARSAASLARWDGSRWSEVVTGGQAVNGIVEALAYWDQKLVAGGFFVTAGQWTVDNIAVFDNGSWEPMDAGIDGYIRALVPYDGGVVAAGYIWSVNGVRVRGIAAWDGSEWRGLGSGLGDGDAGAVAVWEGELIAGGRFEQAGGVAARNVARWDGAAWTAMSTGLDARVDALEVHDGVPYAAGEFAGGVAKWVDGHWQGVGRDFGDSVADLQSTPHGLYVCGPGGLWRWNGQSWARVQIPQGQMTRLGIHKGNLLGAGSFTIPGLPASVGLIRLVEGAWLPVEGAPRNGINTIAVRGFDLAVGGTFRSAGDLPAWGVALRREAETPIAPLHFGARRSGASVSLSCEMMDGAESLSYLLYREDPGHERTLLTATPLSGRREYAFSDSTAPLGTADYWMEQVSYTGDHMAWFGPAHLPSTSELWPLRDVRAVPNPTWGPVSFSFNLPAPLRARIEVFDPSGRTVATLRSGFIGPGPCTVEWDGIGAGGRRLAAGVYWMRLEAGRESRTARFVRVR
jgi:hypothetical protein